MTTPETPVNEGPVVEVVEADLSSRVDPETPETEPGTIGTYKGLVDDLLADLGRISGDEPDDDGVFTVKVSGSVPCADCEATGTNGEDLCHSCGGKGQVVKVYPFKFKSPRSMEEVEAMKEAGKIWIRAKLDPTSPKPPAIQEAMEGRGPRDVVVAFMLQYWSADGQFDDRTALLITRKPAIADMLHRAINKRFDAGYVAGLVSAFQDSKKD